MSKGFLVSLEGPEGAGKTSVLEALIPILEEKGIEVLTTREPGGVLIGEKIRQVILDPSHTQMDPKTELLKVILEKFKDKQLTLLLATDLLARGIDIDSLECVVNFDVPRDIETYTHRAGRTGRMGKEGYVITLVTHPEELKKLKKFASVREIVLKNKELYIK